MKNMFFHSLYLYDAFIHHLYSLHSLYIMTNHLYSKGMATLTSKAIMVLSSLKDGSGLKALWRIIKPLLVLY